MNVKKTDRIIKNLFTGSLWVMIMAFVTTTIGMFIDGIVITNFLGSNAMASMTLVSAVFMVVLAIGGAYSAGSQSLCTQYTGRGDMEKANQILSLTTLLMILTAAVLIVIGLVFTSPITALLGATGTNAHLQPDANGYLRGIAIGIPAIFISLTFAPFMQIDNDRKLAIIAVLAMTVVNIALDLANVFIFHGGMFGMAIATTVSYYVSAAILTSHFFKKRSSYRFNFKNVVWKDSRDIWGNGIASAVGRICTTLRTFTMNRLLLFVGGAMAVTAFGVQNTLGQLFMSVSLGVGYATMMVSGMTIGDEDRTGTRQLLAAATKYAFLLNAAVAAICIGAAPFLTALFLSGEKSAAAPMAIAALRAFGVAIFLSSFNNVMLYYFQGAGNKKGALLLYLLNGFLCSVAVALATFRFMGVNGIWLSFPAGEFLTSLILILSSRRKSSADAQGFERVLFLPEDFGAAPEDTREITITSMEEVVGISEKAQQFCEEKGASTRNAMIIALAVEEMAGNIVDHGFNKDNKKHTIDIRLVAAKNGDFVLRIRDDCKRFDPSEYLELHHPDDPTAHIGIRMIYKMAKEIKYINTLKTNNLILTV
ncbi:MAG: ATP-binding protein [Lachnospiraceae bacterium]|nr:ATP-binding protein [Lachnospiraceae bacterium]